VKVQATGKTDKGYVRSNNEDSFLVDEAIGIYAVADGMGGHKAGEIASKTTLDAMRDSLLREKGTSPSLALERALQTAGIRIFAQIEQDPELRGMGTTLTALLIQPNSAKSATIVHVGDSRCYRWRGGVLSLLTEDHSWVWEQRKAGLISESEVTTHPMRNVITRSVGHGGESNPDILPIDVSPNDLFILCSDGLCGYVSDSEIGDIVRQFQADTKLLTERLIALALDHGGEDNVTVVVVRAL
jgi:protein phosphatase